MATATITSLSVTSGPIEGGYSCTLTGVWSSTTDTYTVTFGEELATNVVVVDNNRITCVVPENVEGLVDVILENTTDPVTFTFSNAFTFLNPGSTTLGLMRDQAKQLADMVNSNFITDTEWNFYLNQSYKELYDILVQKFGDDYYVAEPYSFTTETNEQRYDLPTDFYKLLGVEVNLNTGNPSSWVTLKNFNFIDRNRYSYPNIYTFYGITNLRYRLLGNKIMIAPLPQAGQTLRIWYTPRLNQLVNDGDIVDGVSGWEEYIIIDACIKAWNKQESDPTVFGLQKQALLKRIEEAAENRDPGEASTVSDKKSLNYGGEWGTEGNNGGGYGW